MSDIDFDELDKAVNSLMKPTKSENQTVDKDPSVDAVELGGSPEPTTDEDASTDLGSEAKVESNAAPPPVSLAVKRRGKFMDVIHPSTDMKTKEASASRPSRSGISVQPRGRSQDQDSVSENVAQTAANTVGAEVSMGTGGVAFTDAEPDTTANFRPDLAGTESSPDADWPDPLDTGSQIKAETERKPESDPEDVFAKNLIETIADDNIEGSIGSDEATRPGYLDSSDSMSSPFLPDAKVEKRPLGPMQSSASNEEPSGMSDVVELDKEPNDLAESDSTSTGETVSSEIPDELHTTLMSLENQDVLATEQTSDSDEQREGSDVEPATAESDTDYHETSLDKTTQRSGKPMPLATPSVTERPAQAQSSSQTALSTSLPPRTPLAAADDDEDAISSIFDTDDNALKHSPQHSSGWYTIVVFAGMVIVGVLGAVVFYYMTNNGF